MSAHLYTPQELCNAIYAAVFNAGKPLSRREICEAIGRKKSPHILAVIQYLNEQEFLRASLSKSRQGVPMFVYEIGVNEPDCSDAPVGV